jgi:hypothetical protein
MIRPGCLSSADRIELEACVRRQREDHGIARRGFVAQIGRRVSFPFPQTDLAYCLCDRYAMSGVVVEDGDADLDFRDLPFKVPHHERLTQ